MYTNTQPCRNSAASRKWNPIQKQLFQYPRRNCFLLLSIKRVSSCYGASRTESRRRRAGLTASVQTLTAFLPCETSLINVTQSGFLLLIFFFNLMVQKFCCYTAVQEIPSFYRNRMFTFVLSITYYHTLPRATNIQAKFHSLLPSESFYYYLIYAEI
jgi:hypothetical protein